MAEVFIPAKGAFDALQPKPKRNKPRMEPHGRGQRVLLQAIPGLTARGVLKSPFLFQCTPLDEFPVQDGWDFIDFDTVADGYRSRAGSTQLQTVSFDTLFVDSPGHPFVVNKAGPWNPIEMVSELRAIGDTRTPFQLIAGQPSLWGVWYDVNIVATMRTLRSTERAGERDARYVSVAFTEFGGVTPEQVATKELRAEHQRDTSAIAVLDFASIGPGTTLRDVSQRFYGTTSLWTVIARASGLKIAGSVDLRAHLAGLRSPPKVVVPAPSVAKAARR